MVPMEHAEKCKRSLARACTRRLRLFEMRFEVRKVGVAARGPAAGLDERACPKVIRKRRGACAAEPRQTVPSPAVRPRMPPCRRRVAASMDLAGAGVKGRLFRLQIRSNARRIARK